MKTQATIEDLTAVANRTPDSTFEAMLSLDGAVCVCHCPFYDTCEIGQELGKDFIEDNPSPENI